MIGLQCNELSCLERSSLPSCLLTLCASIMMISCTRSPYLGSAHYACGDGDRVLSTERLFCVYQDARQTRPQDQDQGVTDAGTLDLAGMEVSSSPSYCPPELPYAYTYDTLTLCAAEEDLDPLIVEAAVAQWGQEFAERDEGMDEPLLRDAGVISPADGSVDEPILPDLDQGVPREDPIPTPMPDPDEEETP